MILVFPACTTASCFLNPASTRLQTRLPICHFYYNTCKPHLPSPVITPETVIPVKVKPSSTPIMLNTISVRIITDLLTELNCTTNVNKISMRAITNAFPRNAIVSAICSPSPACLMVTDSGLFLKLSMAVLSVCSPRLACSH